MTNKLERLSACLPDAHTGALVAAPHNLCYLTSFPSGDSWILLTAEKNYFLTDFRYIEMAQATVVGAECVMISRLTQTLAELAEHHDLERIFLEAGETSLAQAQTLAKGVPQVTFETGDELDNWLRDMRAVKDEEEIRRIEAAQRITEAGFDHILPYIREGVTEREVALELEFYMRRQGAQRVAFDFIVVSGANSSLPHGIPSDKPIERGDFITMDFGAVVDGYHSDMTRTVVLGCVTEEQRFIYDTVLKAQQASLSVLKAGLPCLQGDAAARDIIAAAGYGDRFGHGTGHGVGVQIHEGPRLSPAAGDVILQAGNVVTVEPGIYLEGRYGVRIEDMALITEDGCRNLTHCPKELIIL
ncbi:MAG: aminopeptidase P family protein [Clostridia bacterium]|nr:aminopeptidase P family protein [Clostridia bacterium]